MTCQAYWAKQITSRITPRFPLVKIVQARAYGVVGEYRGQALPAVAPSDDDPIKAMLAYLRKNEPAPMILMFHPRGGFSVVNLSAP